MSLTATTLNGAITATDTSLKLTSATGIAVGQLIRIDSEFVTVQDVSASPVVKVERGQVGTLAVAHNTLANAAFGPAADFADVPPGSPVASYGVSGAIAVPNVDTRIFLNKAGVGAMTLADPAVDQDGLQLTIQSSTAQAHTVTNTTGFNGGGTSTDVATFGGAIGDNMVITAYGGKWLVRDLRNVTLA